MIIIIAIVDNTNEALALWQDCSKHHACTVLTSWVRRLRCKEVMWWLKTPLLILELRFQTWISLSLPLEPSLVTERPPPQLSQLAFLGTVKSQLQTGHCPVTLFGKKRRSSATFPRVHRQVLDSEVWCISPHRWPDVLSNTACNGFQNNTRMPFL